MTISGEEYIIEKPDGNVEVYKNRIQLKKEFEGICFLDRDGVIIEETNYIKDPDKVSLIKGIREFIYMIKKRNYAICIVTNQSGINRGYLNWIDYKEVTGRMLEKLGNNCLPDIIIACSCKPDETETNSYFFRKPNVGMIEYCRQILICKDIFPSLIVGDKESDIKCGINSKIDLCYHVETGHGEANKEAVKKLAMFNANIIQIKNLSEIKDNILA